MSSTPRPVPRRALITGGASGFGLAIAEALLAQGASVALGDVDEQRLAAAAQSSLGSERLLPLALDVTSAASVCGAIETCRQHFGGLDTLVNSAGVIRLAPLAEITERDWDWVLDVDLKGAFLCAQAAAPLLRQSGRGRIVNLGSDASKVGFPNLVPYCAAKFGLIGLTKALAGELAADQITVNCVCPVGVASTGMGRDVLDWKVSNTGKPPADILATTAAAIPLRRNASTADVVNAVLFFLSDASAFLTGVALDVDGGALSTVPVPGAAE
jgi:NAD(P)-dependent dehydrogenase (short-subunit alcohol dehydrogenase family)